MSHFFESMYSSTQGFAVPALEEDVCHPYSLTMVKECIDRLAAQSGSKIARTCRIYLAQHQLNPFEAKEFVRKIAVSPTLDSVDWSELTGGVEFMIFLNFAALYSEDLLDASRQLLGTFLDRFEPDGVSVEHHLIIGRYSQTPFGVHVDDATDRVFHFNLGPARKELQLWPRAEFLSTYAGDQARPVELVSDAGSTVHRMPVNSCFHLPADYYHVGRSLEGVSVVVAMAFSRQSLALQVDGAIKEMENFCHAPNERETYYRHFGATVADGAVAGYAQALAAIGFDGLLAHARARRRSNGSFAEILPFPSPDLTQIPQAYRLSSLCPPQLLESQGSLHIYSGGHHAKLDAPEHIAALRHTLSLPRFDLCQRRLRDDLASGNLATAVLAWLVATNGVVRA